jgi:hypothetical protein
MDGETPSVYTETYPKARKEHKCYECLRPIPVGEKYHNFKGCWDGKWDEYKTCVPCDNLRHDVACEGTWPPFGHLSEWACEEGFDFPPAKEAP